MVSSVFDSRINSLNPGSYGDVLIMQEVLMDSNGDDQKILRADLNLYQQIFFPHFFVVSQFPNASMITDLPVIDNIATITQP